MSTLLSRTKALLRDADETRREIARNSGVGYEWLAKFAQDRIPDPGVTRVQKLFDYLSSKGSEQSAA